MKISLRTKLAISFLIVVVITGLVITLAGMHLISDRIIKQAQDKVRIDLNSARHIYQGEIDDVETVIRLTAVRFFLKDSFLKGDLDKLKLELGKVKERDSLDILILTDKEGCVIIRPHNPKISGDSQVENEIVRRVLFERKPYASTEIVSKEELSKEGEDLVERAYMKFIPTPKAKATSETENTSGMMLLAAAPVLDYEGNLMGVLYGGRLINRNYKIVDEVKETVYQDMTYKGKDIGTTTIFQRDLRISTNVEAPDGNRAIGTRVSEEVYDQVLARGKPWIARAFVVNDWYITAYEPIRNISGKIIGILYVGILEKEFVDLKKRTVWIFLSITLVGVIIAMVVSYILASSVTKPVRLLAAAVQQLAEGDFAQKVDVKSRDEIGELGKTFNFMAFSIKERDEQLKQHTQHIVMKSERLAMIGQLAAGVAHEINNPLGGILVYSHLVLEDPSIQGLAKENVEKIVNESTRCKKIVKGLLDFARQTKPEKKLTNVNEVLRSTLSLVEKQALFQNIELSYAFESNLPMIEIDTPQIQQVFMNMIINAAEAMDGKGKLITRTKFSKDNRYVDIEFADTGCGISQENMKKLFEPFFTTKEVGYGTGLGLAISYGIIGRHDGNIDVQSEEGKGTTFVIRLPIELNKQASI